MLIIAYKYLDQTQGDFVFSGAGGWAGDQVEKHHNQPECPHSGLKGIIGYHRQIHDCTLYKPQLQFIKPWQINRISAKRLFANHYSFPQVVVLISHPVTGARLIAKNFAIAFQSLICNPRWFQTNWRRNIWNTVPAGGTKCLDLDWLAAHIAT